MTRKAEFNAEEWSQILGGPPIAGMLVIAAERGGTIRESMSISKAYAEERENHGNSELLDAIVADRPEIDSKAYSSQGEIETTGMERLREALETLQRSSTTNEVDDYKRFVYALADRVARAHKEGGFLGIGGKEVSDDERSALETIATTMGYTPPPAPAGDE